MALPVLGGLISMKSTCSFLCGLLGAVAGPLRGR
jgi:hypothetical protein